MDGTERAIYALEDYMRERGITWEEHETCDDEIESQVNALLGHLKGQPASPDSDPTLAPELLTLPPEVQTSEALLRLLDIDAWIAAQDSPFLADAAAHVSQAHHELTVYRRMTRST